MPHRNRRDMAAAGKEMGGVPALGWWLMVVGAVRLGLAWSGYFGTAALGSATYAQAQVTEVHGRTFGVWTLLSCTLCFLCAFNLSNKPLYVPTFMSFVYGYDHFIAEYLVYHSCPVVTLGTLGFFAVTSMIWMLLQWNSHGHGPRRIAAKQS